MNHENRRQRVPEVPKAIAHRHPDARIASQKDFLPRLIVSAVIFAILFAVCGLLFFRQEAFRAETERIMSYQVTVEGVVTKTWEQKHKTVGSVGTTHYASYRYFYHQRLYTGKTTIRAGSISKDQTITVYIDPDNPSDSRVFHESIWPQIIIAGVMVLSFAYWLFMLNKCRLCFQGRMVIYREKRPGHKNDYKTVWKKIK